MIGLNKLFTFIQPNFALVACVIRFDLMRPLFRLGTLGARGLAWVPTEIFSAVCFVAHYPIFFFAI